MSMPEASGSTCPLQTACGTYTWPSMQHSLNSMLFSVSVPVLSVNTYSTCGRTAALGGAGQGPRAGEAPRAAQTPAQPRVRTEGASRLCARILPAPRGQRSLGDTHTFLDGKGLGLGRETLVQLGFHCPDRLRRAGVRDNEGPGG